MDVDTLKQQQRPSSSSCSPDDQMDMLSIMMQMEKLPAFIDPFQHPSVSTNPFPEIHFSTIANMGRPPTVYQNANENKYSSIIPPLSSSSSPIPFIGQESQMGHFPNMAPYPADNNNNNNNNKKKSNGNSMAAMREMIFRIAVMQPIHIDPESVKPPKRRNVKISKDPQSVAARHRREKISERIRILQRLVPGGTKMDTASMLDEAIHYLKFLKKQVQSLEQAAVNRPTMAAPVGFPGPTTAMVNLGAHAALMRGCQLPMSNHHNQAVGSLQMLR